MVDNVQSDLQKAEQAAQRASLMGVDWLKKHPYVALVGGIIAAIAVIGILVYLTGKL